MAKKEETYNEAIEKLRKIVAEIENGDCIKWMRKLKKFWRNWIDE